MKIKAILISAFFILFINNFPEAFSETTAQSDSTLQQMDTLFNLQEKAEKKIKTLLEKIPKEQIGKTLPEFHDPNVFGGIDAFKGLVFLGKVEKTGNWEIYLFEENRKISGNYKTCKVAFVWGTKKGYKLEIPECNSECAEWVERIGENKITHCGPFRAVFLTGNVFNFSEMSSSGGLCIFNYVTDKWLEMVKNKKQK